MKKLILAVMFLAIVALAADCSSTDEKTVAEKQGGSVAAQLDQANTKLDQANTKVDQANTKVDQANTKVDQANTQLDKAKAETKEAKEAMQDYAFEHRAEFTDMMKSKLATIQVELDRLTVKVENSRGGAKDDAKIKLKEVREKWNKAKVQLDQAESATAIVWNDVKSGFRKSYGELQESFETTRQWLSDKIEP